MLHSPSNESYNNKLHYKNQMGRGTQQTKALNSSLDMPQAVPALKQIAGLRQARVAQHHVHGPDTGSNSRGRRITKINNNQNFHFKLFNMTNYKICLNAELIYLLEFKNRLL